MTNKAFSSVVQEEFLRMSISSYLFPLGTRFVMQVGIYSARAV